MGKNQSKKQQAVTKPAFDFYRYSHWFLLLIVLIVYLPVRHLDLTQLDDTVFINDKHDFVSHFSNITKAFTEGAFNKQDIYYRPLLLVYFILVNPFSSRTSIVAYHLGNMALHILNVLLLFQLLYKLTGNKKHSFWLSAVFAMHPALTMAVAWIPGVNDLLLTTFALGYFLTLLNVVESGKTLSIVANVLFLLFALFTKETGAFLPAGAILLLWYKGYLKPLSKSIGILALLSAACWLAWFFARKNVLPPTAPMLINTDMLSLLFIRAGGLIQYFGKCILPFNLEVFPTIESTSILWGITAIAATALLLYLNKERNNKRILIGILWFILFLLPIFFVPVGISNQLYEHRLYLPMVGILLLLNETILFSSAIQKATRMVIVIAACITFYLVIHNYMPRFNDTFSFWNSAVEASPQSAYANKMLGIKLAENKREKEAIPYFQKAFALDSNERYIRLFLARLIFMPRQQWDSARYYLERETEVNPRYPDTYADLAHVCVERKDFECAQKNIVHFLEFRPDDQVFNSNLLMIYKDEGKYKEALAQANNMKTRGLAVNEGLYKMILDSANNKRGSF